MDTSFKDEKGYVTKSSILRGLLVFYWLKRPKSSKESNDIHNFQKYDFTFTGSFFFIVRISFKLILTITE